MAWHYFFLTVFAKWELVALFYSSSMAYKLRQKFDTPLSNCNCSALIILLWELGIWTLHCICIWRFLSRPHKRFIGPAIVTIDISKDEACQNINKNLANWFVAVQDKILFYWKALFGVCCGQSCWWFGEIRGSFRDYVLQTWTNSIVCVGLFSLYSA